jgi:hypothetical protein
LLGHESWLGFSAGTIDGHVQASETIDREFDETLDVFVLANVGAKKLCLGPKFPKLANPIPAFPVLPTGDDDPGPFPHESVGGGTPNAAQGAGNENDWLDHCCVPLAESWELRVGSRSQCMADCSSLAPTA